ncbi:hypothetical protein RCCS2_17811 [Roseobacter sp. CCS2]|nr:hypothetical protein RCCS2_17811 [Roseobacter sp. CCS2]
MSIFTSACGGSGSSSTDPQLAELNALYVSADAMIERLQPVAFTDPSMAPISGTASYAGYFLGQMANTNDNLSDSLTGEMDIRVDFADTEMVSGTVFGILDDNGDAISGQIDLTGGILDRDGDPNVDATLSFEGNGMLTDINSNNINLDLVFEGDFFGADVAGVAGNILGRAESNGTSQAVGGVFIAEVPDSE